MTTVGGDERPLEDILKRLNDLSRTPRTIDLRQPPPVPGTTAATVAASAERAVPEPSTDAGATIDLTAPVSAPPLIVSTPAVAPQTELPAAEPGVGPAAEVIGREHAPTAASTRVQHESRYGRNGAVAPTVVRQAPMPHNVPVVPVSVREDEADLDTVAPARGRRWLMVLLFLVLVAGAVAALLLAF